MNGSGREISGITKGVFRERRLAALRSTVLRDIHHSDLTLADIPVYQKYRSSNACG